MKVAQFAKLCARAPKMGRDASKVFEFEQAGGWSVLLTGEFVIAILEDATIAVWVDYAGRLSHFYYIKG